MSSSTLADLVDFCHVSYVAFIVIGQLLILVGGWLRWSWVRNVWFRLVHLMAMLYVGLEAALNWPCPLTTWEDQLRQASGEGVTEGSFMGRLLHDLLFVEVPQVSLRGLHLAFAALVVLSWWFVPGRRRSVF